MWKPTPVNNQNPIYDKQWHWKGVMYYVFIWITGIGLLGTLVYALNNFEKDQTLTHHLDKSEAYRLILSVFILIHCITWTICVYAKSDSQNFCLSVSYYVLVCFIIAAWIGLTVYLKDTTHAIFVIIFTASFFLCLTIVTIITQDKMPRYVLLIGNVGLFVAGIFMILYHSDDRFWIVEYTSLIFYSVVFTLYFTLHPYYEWNVDLGNANWDQRDLDILDPDCYNITEGSNPSVPLLVVQNPHYPSHTPFTRIYKVQPSL